MVLRILFQDKDLAQKCCCPEVYALYISEVLCVLILQSVGTATWRACELCHAQAQHRVTQLTFMSWSSCFRVSMVSAFSPPDVLNSWIWFMRLVTSSWQGQKHYFQNQWHYGDHFKRWTVAVWMWNFSQSNLNTWIPDSGAVLGACGPFQRWGLAGGCGH